MRLEIVAIQNLRCYRDEVLVRMGDLTKGPKPNLNQFRWRLSHTPRVPKKGIPCDGSSI